MPDSNGSKGLSMFDQLKRFWFLISFLGLGIISVQMQISENTSKVDQLAKWKDNVAPDVEDMRAVQIELKHLHQTIDELKTVIASLDHSLDNFKEQTLRDQIEKK